MVCKWNDFKIIFINILCFPFYIIALSREEREQRDIEQLPKVRRQSSETAASKDISKAMQDEET